MLELRGVHVFYGEAQALWSMDLDVAEGEIVCIVGPNGAGKTTLVQAIAGMLPVSRGSVRVGGQEVAGQPAHLVCRTGVAIVPEGRRIFPGMTVEIASRGYVLSEGRIALDGSASELLANPELRRTVLGIA